MAGEYVGRGGNVARITLTGERLDIERWGTTKPLRAVGPNEVVIEDEPHQRFRLLAHDGGPGRAYLVSSDDGYTYYRNEPTIIAEDAPCQNYGVDYLGNQVATLRMRGQNTQATLEGEGFLALPPLQLTRHAPALYFCSMGEALDLTSARPAYANIPLRPHA